MLEMVSRSSTDCCGHLGGLAVANWDGIHSMPGGGWVSLLHPTNILNDFGDSATEKREMGLIASRVSLYSTKREK